MAQQMQCEACKQPIKFKWLNVENLKLHPECFKCSECNQTLNRGDKYYKNEDDDASFICTPCTQKKSKASVWMPFRNKNKSKNDTKPKSIKNKPTTTKTTKIPQKPTKSTSINDENQQKPPKTTITKSKSVNDKDTVGSTIDNFGKKLISKTKKFAMEKVMKVEPTKETDEIQKALDKLTDIKQIIHSLSDKTIANWYKQQEDISRYTLSLSEALNSINLCNNDILEENEDKMGTKLLDNVMGRKLLEINKITNEYLVKMEKELINPIYIYKSWELKTAALLIDEYESVKIDYDFAVYKYNKLINPKQKQKQNKISEAENKKKDKFEILEKYRVKVIKCIADLESKKQIHLLQCLDKFWKSYLIFGQQKAQIVQLIPKKEEDEDVIEEEKEVLSKELRYKNPIKIGSGAFATVYRATDIMDNDKQIAIKKICIGDGDNVLYLNSTKAEAQNELNVMKCLNKHNNIVELIDDFYEETAYNDLYLNLIMQYLPQTLLSQLKYYAESGDTIPHDLIQIYSFQLIKALNYMHLKKIAHRDIKPDNVLINVCSNELKLCDFGCCIKMETRYHGENEEDLYYNDLLEETKEGNYQSYVCSRYYRAPELILQSTYYDCKVDIWSFGCIISEMFLGTILFEGYNNEEEQLDAIIQKLGAPKENNIEEINPYYRNKEDVLNRNENGESWDMLFCAVSNMPQNAIELISKILIYSPKERLSALNCLKCKYFDDLKQDNKYKELLFNWTDLELEYAMSKGITL